MATALQTQPAPMVLVVDPDPLVRTAFGAALRGTGACLREARTAEEAWEVLSREAPTLVVTDYRLNGQDGVTLLEQLRERFPRAQRILHTSERVRRCGLDIPVLGKPCSPEALRELLIAVLHGPARLHTV